MAVGGEDGGPVEENGAFDEGDNHEVEERCCVCDLVIVSVVGREKGRLLGTHV